MVVTSAPTVEVAVTADAARLAIEQTVRDGHHGRGRRGAAAAVTDAAAIASARICVAGPAAPSGR
jgi:hypothetical protein